ncbi:MAG: 23S rRNA (pseudouridine(1915)-N(3))-methyltransferase RlmH, partial [Hyphomicrobium sp.]|nr:23S rRNA (pseudouridine(1915)-N(3))-methyltransferase RlmH [Hyphomicrobium sp.]
MHVSVYAVGRMKAGPERELAGRFLDRFAKAGPAFCLDFTGVTEIPE